ncbi:MAG TPA: hypothetical protein VJ870_14955 [Amycolatopsis sp.]|nr:hypothetical protein [Amycolatopsis sp.]
MSDIHTGTRSAPVDSSVGDDTGTVTGWAGWVVFAAIMMIVLGAFQVIQGLVAIFHHSYYLVTANNLVVNVNYTAWGWVHFILGLVAVGAGFGLLTGNMVARVLGIVVAVVSAILNLAFVAAYPVWSVVIIAVDVVVIYAIAVHGRELKT